MLRFAVQNGACVRNRRNTGIDAALRIDPKTDRFTGHVEIDVKFLKTRRSLFLHGLNLNISAVTVLVKGKPVAAAHYDQGRHEAQNQRRSQSNCQDGRNCLSYFPEPECVLAGTSTGHIFLDLEAIGCWMRISTL